MSEIYDKNGLPIRQGDIVKMFHFVGARGKRHYMYKQAGETVILGKAKPEPFMRFSHLDLTDAYFVEILDDRKRDDLEIVQGVEAFWEERPKCPSCKPQDPPMADPAVKLTPAERDEMLAMDSPRYHPSSNRHRDRIRTKLKKAGLVRFKRSEWKWGITNEGRALLEALKEGGEGR